MPVAEIDQLIARAKRTAFLGRSAIAAQAKGCDIVVERHVEPIARRCRARLAQAVDQLVAHEPA